MGTTEPGSGVETKRLSHFIPSFQKTLLGTCSVARSCQSVGPNLYKVSQAANETQIALGVSRRAAGVPKAAENTV